MSMESKNKAARKMSLEDFREKLKLFDIEPELARMVWEDRAELRVDKERNIVEIFNTEGEKIYLGEIPKSSTILGSEFDNKI